MKENISLYIGGFWAFGSSDYRDLSIENCSVDGNINVNSNLDLNNQYSNVYVGGICGYSYSTIKNCNNNSNISIRSTNGAKIGGISGGIYPTITDCMNTGEIKGYIKGQLSIGGIIGENGYIQNCINTGNINGRVKSRNGYSYTSFTCDVGGICGDGSSEIVNCINKGNVKGSTDFSYKKYGSKTEVSVGGIAGRYGFMSLYGHESPGILHNNFNISKNIISTKINSDGKSEYGPAGRIIGSGWITDSNKKSPLNYSWKATLVNSSYIKEETTENGITKTIKEIEELSGYDLKSLPGDELLDISVTNDSYSSTVGTDLYVQAGLSSSKYTEKDIKWTNSDENIAKIESVSAIEDSFDDTSRRLIIKIKSISQGTCTITGELPDGTKATFTVKVYKIIDPLNVELTTESILSNDTNNAYYLVTAKITNKSDTSSLNTKIKIKKPPYFKGIDEFKEEIELGDMDSGETKNATWVISTPKESIQQSFRYSVVVASENSAPIEKTSQLILIENIKKSNDITSDDWWSLFHTNVENYHINSDDLRYLYDNLSNTEISTIEEQLNKDWEGSCYGLSSTALLFKIGRLHQQNFDSKSEKTSDISLNEKVKSLINFYQVQQYTDEVVDDFAKTKKKSNKENIEKLIGIANNTENGGIPALLSFDYSRKLKRYEKESNKLVKTLNKSGGHTILAYGKIENRKNDQNWTYGGISYDYRIKTYDVNFIENPTQMEDRYFYYTKDMKKWTIPYYTEDRTVDGVDENGVAITNVYKVKKSSLRDITNDIELIDVINIENKDYVNTYEKNQNAILRSKELTDMIIKDYNNNSVKINDGIIDKNEFNVWTYYDSTDLNNSSNGINVILPDLDKPYTIETMDKENKSLDFTLNYEDISIDIEVSSGNSVKFNPDGSATFNGDNSDCNLTLVSNNKLENLDYDTIQVKSDNVSNLSLEKSSKGFIISGDNLEDVDVTVKNIKSDKGENISISSDQDKVLVTKQNEEVKILEDRDDDNDFETVAPTGEEKVTVKFNSDNNQKNIIKNIKTDEILNYTPKAPTKEGYTFVGWYKDVDDTTTEYKSGSKYTENVTYTAKWAHVTMLGAKGKVIVNNKSGIRFGTKIYNDGDEIVEKGTLILPAKFLSEGESLTLETEKAARSVGKINYEVNKEKNYVTYLGTIINIPRTQFDTEMTAASYVIYKDKAGNKYTVYSPYKNGSTTINKLLN